MNEKEIEKSYNLGIDFFDTANRCSSETSEEYLGKALKNNVQKYLLHKKKKEEIFMELKQTAGRTALGEFAPKFAQLNDDVLFGEVWSRKDKLSLRDRSIVTVVALAAQGLTDSSLKYHLESAKKKRSLQNGDC